MSTGTRLAKTAGKGRNLGTRHVAPFDEETPVDQEFPFAADEDGFGLRARLQVT